MLLRQIKAASFLLGRNRKRSMKNKSSYYFKITCLVCLAFLMNACKTNKNTFMHRGWHNMTARFNGYYYSNENIKETVKKIEKANKDDFSKILPLFIYTNNNTSNREWWCKYNTIQVSCCKTCMI
jgi:hypothetical protein